jgi:tetratricopeptide (TPR) repeat protein
LKLGRNDLCACGSGKKYKKCCGQERRGATTHRSHGRPPDLSEFTGLIREGRYSEIEQAASRLVRDRPDWALGWKLLSFALWHQGKDAMEALERAAAMLPQDSETHSNLGNALRRRGRAAEAVASLRRALSLRPRHPETHNDLGVALRDLGDIDAAIACFRRALELRPDLALASMNLGYALGRLGMANEAERSFRDALRADPALVAAHMGLGEVLLTRGSVEGAAECYRRATEIQPDLAEAHTHLGNALRDLGQSDAAVAEYRRALELRPEAPEAHYNLSVTLRLLHRYQEAEASARRAHHIDPTLAAPLVCLAELKADQGRFGEAEDLLERALAVDPHSADACSAIPRLRRMTLSDHGWLAAAERVAAQQLSAPQRARLQYAIGKYFDDIGKFPEAFTHYQRANELKKTCCPPYETQRFRHLVSQIIERCGPERLGPRGASAPGTSRPVFIVGMPRSGTSLVEQILAAHPRIFGAGELPFWSRALADWLSDLPAGAASAERLQSLADRYLGLLDALDTGAAHVIDKMPANFLALGLIHAAVPQARIIHLRRHPIDTCVSIYFQDFEATYRYANDLEDLAHYYTEYRRVMAHWRSVLPADTMIEVCYEQLVSKPEAVSRGMLEFLGVEWNPACLEFHRICRTVITASKWQVRQEISKSSVGRWINYAEHVAPLRRLMELERSADT